MEHKIQNQKVTQSDYEFLRRINGLQQALIASSANPVCIWKITQGADFQMKAPGMYYDCVSDERLAMATIKKRIKLAKPDIIKHYKTSKDCLDKFLDLDSAIICNDREAFAYRCEELSKTTNEYIDLVKDHKTNLKEDSFLFYPYCPPGHYFHIVNGPWMGGSYFNMKGTLNEAQKDLNEIKNSLIDFKISDKPLPYIALPLNCTDGAGLYMQDMKIGLQTNKNLLKRAGLEL